MGLKRPTNEEVQRAKALLREAGYAFPGDLNYATADPDKRVGITPEEFNRRVSAYQPENAD